MNVQKALPVVASILIILVVAVLRDRSRTLAAIVSTMPINMVLALWIVAEAPDVNPDVMVNFVRSLLIGLGPSLIWLIVVYFGLRQGWNVWVSVLTGYLVWGGLTALAFATGIYTLKR